MTTSTITVGPPATHEQTEQDDHVSQEKDVPTVDVASMPLIGNRLCLNTARRRTNVQVNESVAHYTDARWNNQHVHENEDSWPKYIRFLKSHSYSVAKNLSKGKSYPSWIHEIGNGQECGENPLADETQTDPPLRPKESYLRVDDGAALLE